MEIALIICGTIVALVAIVAVAFIVTYTMYNKQRNRERDNDRKSN